MKQADLLAELLAPYPELQIVLTASSLSTEDFGGAKAALQARLQRRGIGFMHEISDVFPGWTELSRCEQIQRYANSHGIHSWLALERDGSDWPDDLSEKVVCLAEIATEPSGGLNALAEKLEQLHNNEFRRITAQHDWTLNALAANKHMEAAAQALADARSNSDDMARLQAAGAAVFSCGIAIASAQSCRVTRVYGNEGLLVAFLGNALDWNRDRRSVVLKLLDLRRVDSQAMPSTPSEASMEMLGLAETTLEETRRWLANERESHGL